MQAMKRNKADRYDVRLSEFEQGALGRKPLVQCERGPVQHRTQSENTCEMPSDQRPT